MRQYLNTCLAGLAATAAALMLITAVKAQPAPLTICLEEDSPPLSFSFGPRKGGFDHGVAEEIAKRMGRPLKVQWFESENDEEAVPVWEANALLSDGLCDLIAGYPLLGSTLGKPETDKGAVPEYEGMKRSERGRLVKLGVLSATQPYYRAGYGVIVGPAADPAKVGGMKDAPAALKMIADAKTPFASRGDDSGTHKKEKLLWKAAGVDADASSGSWYRETGSGMGATLNAAVGMGAYALTDRATWISFKNKGDFKIQVEGDKVLFNQYGVILVNPAKHPAVKKELGQSFIDWVTGEEGQKTINSYKLNGQQLFFANAS